jgi:hypothetical protein
MKPPYPFLSAIAILFKVIGVIVILNGFYYLISGAFSFFGQETPEFFRTLIFIMHLIMAVILFALSEFIHIYIDISINSKQSVKELQNISNSMLERDKMIVKMMGIIVEQMKNK